MAAPAAVARMRSVLHDNFVAARWLDKIVESADGLLPAPPSVGPATLDIARQFVLRIETLGIVWFATGDPRYRDRARQELLAMCGLPDWRWQRISCHRRDRVRGGDWLRLAV